MVLFGLGNYGLTPVLGLLLIVPVIAIAAYALAIGYRSKKIKTAIIVVVVIVVIAAFVEVSVISPLTSGKENSGIEINVGKGYVAFDASETGAINVTTSEIANVSVVHMDTGLLVMHRDHGLGGRISQTVDYINVGVYTLSNGAKAYVASNNLTNLVIGTTGNYYVVLGPQNMTAFLTDFSKYVSPVPGY